MKHVNSRTQTWIFYTHKEGSDELIACEREAKVPSRTKAWRELVRLFERGELHGRGIGYKIKQ